MTDNRNQNDLALERTHAAWIRTCLTFLVTAIAVRHYTNGEGEWAVALVLAAGGVVSALRASVLAPDLASRLMSLALISVSFGSIFINI